MELLFADIKRYLELSKGIKHPKIPKIIVTCLNYRMLPNVFFRMSQLLYNFKYLKIFSYFFYAINVFLFRIEIPPRIKIGGGLFMPHPQNIICGAKSIGESCTIYQGVTIGAKHLDFEFTENLRPVIMGSVTIGSNSVIIGPTLIGAKSKIAPNTLVMKNVDEEAVIIGNHI